MKPAVPIYAFVMLALTATYLAVEVAFAGYLVDMLSGSISHADFGADIASGVVALIAVYGSLTAIYNSIV